MRKSSFSERLKLRMNEINLSAAELSRKMRLSEAVISQYKNGKYEPKQDRLEHFAKTLDVSEAWLMGYDVPRERTESENNSNSHTLIEGKTTKHNKGIKIPVLGVVAAGVPIEAFENVIDYEEIPEEMAKTGEFFALRIKGTSMEPRILDGDVVIVRKQPDIDSGEIAVVLINGDEATVKSVKKSKNGIMITAYNPTAWEPRFYDNEDIKKLPVRILGKVVELRGKF